MKKKIGLLSFLFMIISISQCVAVPQNVPQNKYRYEYTAGETNQFRFRERTQVSIYGNVSMDVSIDCDAENVGEKYFNFSYYGEDVAKINMSINASNSMLQHQNRIRTRNGSLYEFRHRFIVNISRNTTEGMSSSLRLRISEQNCTWVYYNETEEEFEIIPSYYDGEYLVANVTHFSLYAVVGGIEDSTPKWWIIYIVGGCIVIVTLYITISDAKNRKKCPNGKKRLKNGECPQ